MGQGGVFGAEGVVEAKVGGCVADLVEAFEAEGGDDAVGGFEGGEGVAAAKAWGGEGGGLGGEEAVEEIDLGGGCC